MAEDNNNMQSDVLSALVAEIRSLREESSRRNTQFEERFIALELQQHQQAHIPKFGGDKAQWRSWKLETEGKLRVDKEALGDAEGHFMYIFMSLEGKAKDNVTTFVEMQTEKKTFNVAELLNRLELLYGERDRKQRATRNLHSIKQGENEPFTSFYPRFEREIANANAEYWPDDSKISYLQEALNDKMKAALIGSDPSAISSYVGLARRCDSLSSQMELLGQWKRPRGNTKSSDNYDNHQNHGGQAAQKQSGQKTEVRREDMMEWEPTLQASAKVNAARTRSDKNTYGHQSNRPEDQALLGKRAKWVDQTEMDARYREGRCLRCGRDNCRIERCPLAAPIRPANATRRTQVNAVAPTRPAVTNAEIAEDEASSHSDEDSD
ncbi:retrotransposon gag protein [Hirsutella rhossiliensis]|uniref:Retrotransposon gag protein n=1 Tax=Hirsutella rhossiliensis TaxID=111463 RepID=A0A9P8N9G1_9HYPO|nr:retrotransposon gag protein [Hirsutella rhossiliensis]KAH0967062.1 retrotransposon gag protein [Hirsutella rhossiliensis]